MLDLHLNTLRGIIMMCLQMKYPVVENPHPQDYSVSVFVDAHRLEKMEAIIPENR